MCSWNTFCGLKDLELEDSLTRIQKSEWSMLAACMEFWLLCQRKYGKWVAPACLFCASIFMDCTRNGSSFWRTSPPFFISSHLLSSNSKSHCAVLQQVLGKNTWPLDSSNSYSLSWPSFATESVPLWNAMQMLSYLMAVVNLQEFICCVRKVFLLKFTCWCLSYKTSHQIKRSVILMIFDKLQKSESLPSGQMKKQNTVASCKASWLRYRWVWLSLSCRKEQAQKLNTLVVAKINQVAVL